MIPAQIHEFKVQPSNNLILLRMHQMRYLNAQLCILLRMLATFPNQGCYQRGSTSLEYNRPRFLLRNEHSKEIVSMKHQLGAVSVQHRSSSKHVLPQSCCKIETCSFQNTTMCDLKCRKPSKQWGLQGKATYIHTYFQLRTNKRIGHFHSFWSIGVNPLLVS